MSKSITENELAENLAAAYVASTWQEVAALAAELLGVELAPEKPEPVELSEAEVANLYPEWQPDTHTPFGFLPSGDKWAVRVAVNAALKSYGHGVRKGDLIGHKAPLITREQVERAVAAQSLTSGRTITGITDAVMALLGASK